MGNFEKIAGRATLLIPVVHLVTCGLYMAGYSLGFGGNIGGLFSASDFFTITIQHLISTYISGAGMPALLLFLRHRSGQPYISDSIAVEQDEVRRNQLETNAKFVRNTLGVGLILIFVLYSTLFIAEVYTDTWTNYYILSAVFMLTFYPLWFKLAARLKFYDLPVEIAWGIISFAISIVALGVDSGERDRRFAYTQLAKDRMKCSAHVVLTPIGARFLSVTPDGIRHIINDECKVMFDFQKRPIFEEGNLFDMVLRKWTGDEGQALKQAAHPGKRAD